MRPVLVALAVLAALLPATAASQGVPCIDGLATLPDDDPTTDDDGPYPCNGVRFLARLPVSTFASPGSPAPEANNDVWGWTDAQTGREYALVGTQNGTAFVDVSTPTAPVYLGKLPTATVASIWRDVKVYRDHAFVVADGAGGHGMQVFNLARLRAVSAPPATFEADAVYTGLGSAHNVVVNEATGFAYAVGSRPTPGLGLPPSCGERGLHMIDVRDPKRPAFAGCVSDAARDTNPVVSPGYTHDAQCVVYAGPDADYRGRELCFASNEDVVTVFDVTDKAAARIVSQVEYPNDRYTHQGWLTEDHRFFLANDELDELQGNERTQRTLILNVEDLDEPEYVGAYDSGLPTIDHNLYVRDGFVYESNYEAGLRILDARGVADGVLQEVAFFDTFPSRTTITTPCLPPQQGRLCSSFNGQWSNYPYFESGVVVANDADNGLFVLRPDPLAPPVVPDVFSLSNPVPNPTATGARLTLFVEADQEVRAELLDAAGRRVRTLYSGPAVTGRPVRLTVPAAGLAAGVYLVHVVGERFETTRQVTVAR